MSLYVSSVSLPAAGSTQNSSASETALAGSTIDLSLTNNGQFYYIVQNTDGVHSVTVGLQTSVDGNTWLDSTVTGVSDTVANGAYQVINNVAIQVSGLASLRFVRLSIKNYLGNVVAVQFVGGFAT